MAMDEGIIMAADDLVYVEKGGTPIPTLYGVSKVRVAAENILIGSVGMMTHPKIKYSFDVWVSSFIETQRNCGTIQRPSEFAAALRSELRKTMEGIASSPEEGGWQGYKPGEWLVSFNVAGYAETFQQHYLFEVGAQVDSKGHFTYPPPRQHRTDKIRFGEDEFLMRAVSRIEPQHTEWISGQDRIGPTIGAALQDIPRSLQEALISIVSLIKVEAKFNTQKVGSGVFVVGIDRITKSSFAANF